MSLQLPPAVSGHNSSCLFDRDNISQCVYINVLFLFSILHLLFKLF